MAYSSNYRSQITYQSKIDGILVSPARKPALKSGCMFGEPLTHLVVGPGPLEGMGIAMVVLRPGSHDVGLEFLLALPRPPFQVVVLEGMDQDLCLVQPRR